MKILLAFDSFKESMSSLVAADAFTEGFLSISPNTTIEKRILSDGGEGFIEALTFNSGECKPKIVKGPLCEDTKADYGILNNGKTAVIEMARASGLELVPDQKRNPMKTTSYGTGQLINEALEEGCSEILIGIGGSATVEGGCGMAQALGAQFYNDNEELMTKPISGEDLSNIHRIDLSSLNPKCKTAKFTIACDVDNPLIGEQGAAKIFGPQKGADEQMVEKLEKGLTHLCALIKRDMKIDVETLSGGGAAGGIGAMFCALLNAKLKKGIDIVTDAINLEESVLNADLIISGEGRIDQQTIHGKTVSGVLNIASKHNKAFLAIGGSVVNSDLSLLQQNGIQAVMTLINEITDLQTAIKNGPVLMKQTGARLANLINCIGNIK